MRRNFHVVALVCLLATVARAQEPPLPSPAGGIKSEILEGEQLIVGQDQTTALFSSTQGGSFWIFVATGNVDQLEFLEHEITLQPGGIARLKVRTSAVNVAWKWKRSTPPIPPAPPSTIEGKVALWKSRVPGKTTDDEAAMLAASFDSVAAMIAAGTLQDNAAVAKTLKESNKAMLSAEARTRWQAAFFIPLAAEFDAMQKAGNLKDPHAYAAVFRKVSAGLK